VRRRFTGVALLGTGLIVLSLIILGRTVRVAQVDEGGSRARRILYVTNSAGDDVTLVDADTHRVIGSIETGTTPHGLVASPDGRRIYITGETDDDVVAVDTTTAKVLWKAPVGEQPNEPALTADGRHIYVPIRMGEVADVVDTTTGKRINSIRIGRVPHNAYPSYDGKWIYVTSRGDEKISIIDPATQQMVGDVPLGGEPRPVAFTKDNTRAYSTLTGLHGFVVADLALRKVIERIELPKADLPEISVSGYTDTHGIALTRDDKQFWATNVFGNAVTAFSVPEHKVLTTVPVGLAPNWMTFSPDGELLYVSNSGSNDVSVIDLKLLREVVRIPVGMSPKRLLVVTVPEGMGGPDEAGWRTAARRPSTTDYWVRGGGTLGAETHSFRARFATGEVAAESIPGWYRKLGLPHVAINTRHITSWESDSLDRIKSAIRDEGRLVSAVLIDTALIADGDAANSARIEEYQRMMRAADYLGAPLVRITVGAAGVSDQTATVDRATAALKQLLPAARELGLKIAIGVPPGSTLSAESLLRIVNGVDPAVLGVALEIESGERRSMTKEQVSKLAPFVSYLRVKATAFDKYGEETTIDFDEALSPFERSGYAGSISIGFDGDSDPVTGVIKTRDLLVKHWVGSAKTK
jgi:YVTN family beta-propeller protein